MKKLHAICAVFASTLSLFGCQSSNPSINGINHANPVLKSNIYTVNDNQSKVGELSLRPVKGGVHIYGQLAGAFYGIAGIPQHWIEGLEIPDYMDELIRSLAEC